MTYVEFFDNIASENVCACLTYVPDRVIYIGDNAKLINEHISRYEKVFEARGYGVEFIPMAVTNKNLDDYVTLISEIVEAYDDCVFDITGGEEMLILALGIVYSKYPDKNIQIHKLNLRNNAIYDCDKDGTTIFRDTPTLSIDENVRIYGGEVAYGSVDEQKTYKWDLTPDFLNDIELIWNVCKGNVRYWNVHIGAFEAAEAVGTCSEDGLTTVASREEIEKYLKKKKEKYSPSKGIAAYLLKKGLIKCFEDDGTTVTIYYKNAQVKKCLTKAGQALEMKIFVTVKDMLEADGTPMYDEALNGVVIDWDGEFHDEKTENIYDTENEIDIMLMHDVVPIFISCKNGKFSAEELYKLNTVAERFGGNYSKKVLVATAVSELGEKGKYLRQRAKDMKINLIEDVHQMEDAELKRNLKKLWNK